MSIRCRLGLHQATRVARWNDGYYFSSCRRCGRDLIRTPFESWHVVPRGHRVVWSATAPANRRTAALAREPDAPEQTRAPAASHAELPGENLRPVAESHAASPKSPPADRPRESDDSLPIIEVLRLLREDEERQTAVESAAADDSGLAPAALQLAADAAVASATAGSEPSSAAPPEPSLPEPGAPMLAIPEAEPLSRTDDEPRDGGLSGHSGEAPPPPPLSRPEDVQQPLAVSLSQGSDAFDDDFMAEPDGAADDEDFWGGIGDSPPQIDPQPPPFADAAREALPEPSHDPHEAPPAAEPRLASHESSLAPEAALAHPAPLPGLAPIAAADGATADRARLGLGLGAALLLAGATIVALRGNSDQAAAIAPTAAMALNAGGGPSRTEPAYVATRLLNCRAAPVSSAQALRILGWGQAVRVLAREPGWVSIAYDGGQCWVDERFLSAERQL